jgi:hypothetical protein
MGVLIDKTAAFEEHETWFRKRGKRFRFDVSRAADDAHIEMY